jgi:hypothetical protein
MSGGETRKEGWLKKSAPILGGKKVLWKAKWCVLEVNDSRRVVNLLYFDKQRDAVPKACDNQQNVQFCNSNHFLVFLVFYCSVIPLARAAIGPPSVVGYPYSFSLVRFVVENDVDFINLLVLLHCCVFSLSSPLSPHYVLFFFFFFFF